MNRSRRKEGTPTKAHFVFYLLSLLNDSYGDK